MTVAEVELLLRSPDATWCYERWERLPNDGNRYEVIDGVLYMTTAPGFRHQWIGACLVEHVGRPLYIAGAAVYASAPIGVIMLGADPVQPDFVLIRTERTAIIADDDRIRGVPDLIAEVLSPSNPEHDLVTKRRAYARAEVPEYWILRPVTRDVLVHSQPDPGIADFTEVHLFATDAELVSPTLPVRVPVAALFEDPLRAARSLTR